MRNPDELLAHGKANSTSNCPRVIDATDRNDVHRFPSQPHKLQRSLIILLLLGSLMPGYAFAQAVSVGPRPIYLKADVLKWQFALDRGREEVFSAVITAGEGLGFAVASRDDDAGILVLSKSIGTGVDLDEHCKFPIVNYYNWNPMATFAETQRRLVQKRGLGESAAFAGKLGGSVRVSIHVDNEGTCKIEGLCRAARTTWGWSSGTRLPYLPDGLQSTSKGLLEKQFIEGMLKQLGLSATIDIPTSKIGEPARTDPTRDLYLAESCDTGVSVDPKTMEIRCQ